MLYLRTASPDGDRLPGRFDMIACVTSPTRLFEAQTWVWGCRSLPIERQSPPRVVFKKGRELCR